MVGGFGGCLVAKGLFGAAKKDVGIGSVGVDGDGLGRPILRGHLIHDRGPRQVRFYAAGMTRNISGGCANS